MHSHDFGPWREAATLEDNAKTESTFRRDLWSDNLERHELLSMDDNALLLALGELISQEISATQLLERLVDVIARAMDADRGTIYLLDRERHELVSIAAHLPELEELRIPLHQGVAGYVARTGRMVNSPHSDSDVRFYPGIDAETGYTTRSMLAGPLYDNDGELLGVVQVLNKRNANGFSERDEILLERISKQAASLIQETTLAHAPNFVPAPALPEAEPPLLGERFNRVIGTGKAMREVFQTISKVAPTEATVLIRGESGTGKTVIARALHYNSRRRGEAFVHVDSTTLPETLIENELFGHERGAYTGAHERKIGRVEAASGGTLFLDEIGDLPLAVQGKLLTLLQDRTFSRVGGTERMAADIRIIAATNRDLESLVQQGKFREDLYYRLRVVQVRMPSLRERGREDLLALINHFVSQTSKRHGRTIRRVRQDALQMLLGYSWPGNVRELENCIEAAVIFAEGEITPSTLSLPRPGTTRKLRAINQDFGPQTMEIPLDPDTVEIEPPPEPFADEPTLRELEARYIEYLLTLYDGNRSACARTLDIGRNTLLRKMKEYNLE
jgi:Nif-specific regulatory protein